MKEIYQCEKCGKLWDSYAEAWECEARHVNVSPLDKFDLHPDDQDAIAPEVLTEYVQGESLPKSITVKFSRMGGDGCQVTDANGAPVYGVAFYSLDKLTRSNELLRDQIAASVNRKSAKDQLELNEWRAQREATAKAADEEVEA